ncbi:MAG: xanthine dehydrogenase FAD-binding subunit XdhB [Treponema sp.]|jgi:xanthine dehydrogenase FAD-binding subunit|nr:xanthine dehydrogenase FAD-binding subunit XdhB [Treponema sp.]
MYDIAALYEAESVEHAIALLEEHQESRIIAGGSDVLIHLRAGKLVGAVLVSIQKLDALRGISLEQDGSIRIGALTSFSRITQDPLIQTHLGVLGEAVSLIGGPQIRNIGTIGGNTCNGVSSADSGATLMALDAIMEYRGPKGVRLVPIQEHYVGPGKTALSHEELLTAITIPQESYRRCYGHYLKYAMRNAMDIATLGCSVNVRLTEDNQYLERVRIGFGVAGPVPMRSPHAEAALQGKPVSEASLCLAGTTVLKDVQPRSSWRASKDLRVHLVEELTKRALACSIRHAGGLI